MAKHLLAYLFAHLSTYPQGHTAPSQMLIKHIFSTAHSLKHLVSP